MSKIKKTAICNFTNVRRIGFCLLWPLVFFMFLVVNSGCSNHKKLNKNIAYKSKKSNHKPINRKPKTVRLPPAEQKPAAKISPLYLQAIAEARSYIGTPHRLGGVSRSGIDCSGLIMLSYKKVGVALPRSSREQSAMGRPVRLESISAGDLVFFSDKRLGNNINHVGMVTEVNGAESIRFIHTSTSLGVTENNLYSDYYYRNFVKAIRVQ